MKKILITLMVLLSLVGCKTKEVEETVIETVDPVVTLDDYATAEINVGMLKGPTGMGMAKLMEDSSNGLTHNTYNFTLDSDATVLNQMLIKGELDMASIPTNAVAALNNKTEGKILLLAINTSGNLYVLTKDDSIKTLKDLEGKSVVSAGAAANPEYIMNYLLDANDLTDKVAYTANEGTDHAAAIAEFAAGKYDAIMLPQPFVTQCLANVEGTIAAINLTEEFETVSGTTMTLGAIAVRRDFAEANPEAVALFMLELADSIEFVNTNVDEAAALCEKFDVIKEAVAKKAISTSGIVFIEGDEMKTAASNFLNVLFNQDPKAVGGKLPTDEFFLSAQYK